MKFRNFGSTLVLLLMAAISSFGAVPNIVESARAHAATGAFGCTVSGVTVATPAVVTCAAAHKLIDGDAIQITGVGGTTTVNTVGYAKITGYSTTTFGFYSDSGLTTGITGTGAYTSGGVVTMAFPVSALTGDWTLRLREETLTSGATALVSIQESADGFVSDIRTLAVFSFKGSTGSGKPIDQTVRAYQLPAARFGTANVTVRVYVQALSAGTYTGSFYVEY
jgi:hypothetical protein